MDRRTILKSAVALSSAAVLPAAAAVVETPVVPPEAALVQPAKLSPYTNYVWEWFVSHDGEYYYESFATKEEALQYAKQEEYSIVSECIQQDFPLRVDGWRLIEEINEGNYEMMGEDQDGITCTSAQEKDLEKMVEQAIEAWVVKHNIDIRAWSFKDMANKTEVEL